MVSHVHSDWVDFNKQSLFQKTEFAVYGGVIQLLDIIKNILICVPNLFNVI